MTITQDTHRQFAAYFRNSVLEPYLYLLSKNLSQGQVCVDLKTVGKEEFDAPEAHEMASPEVLKNEALISDGTEWKPFVIYNDKLYFQRYFYYETVVLDQIQALLSGERNFYDEYKEKLTGLMDEVRLLFPDDNSGEPDWQLIAALSAVVSHFMIITGGPGTGKTTTVAKILSLLFYLNPDLKIALTAPTGKAASRMAESLRNSKTDDTAIRQQLAETAPATIHQLLGFSQNSIHPRYNSENTLPHDLVIVDEGSMIDLALFAKLLSAIRPSARIILLGDRNQLDAVEVGSLFGELCTAVQDNLNKFGSEKKAFFSHFMDERKLAAISTAEKRRHLLFEHVIELKKSYRFSDSEGIGKLSKAIVGGDQKTVSAFFKNDDERVKFDTTYADDILDEFALGYRDYIVETDIHIALEKLNRLRVLCAIREGPQGVYSVNEKIRKLLQNKGWIRSDGDFFINRPVMVTKNNYETGLHNGDIGIIRTGDDGQRRIWFEDNNGSLFSVLPAFAGALETVFAMTIHKSQGSEYDDVMIILPQTEMTILTRELVYTAATRAKRRLLIQSSEEVMLNCLEKRAKTGSGIIDRLSQIVL